MILYISNSTEGLIYDKLFQEKKIVLGYQMQKFNSNIVKGLSREKDVCALSVLQYLGVKAERFEKQTDRVRYIAIKNTPGYLHGILNVCNLFLEGTKILRKEKIQCIICDAIALSPCKVSVWLGKKFKIPTVGIITDLPGLLPGCGNDPQKNISVMQHFDAYILLTEQMNSIVNIHNKPYMVMEGLAPENPPELLEKNKKRIIIYSGALWKNDAGIEYFTEGFIKANIPDTELHYYGTGEAVQWIKKMEEKYPNIKYKGAVSNMEIARYQSEATLLVNPRPSGAEFCKYSFPSKTIEYMYSGTPVLMTKLPGVPKEYFDYVFLIEEETAEGVCSALNSIFAYSVKDLDDIGQKARKFISEEKNQIKQTKKIIDFIDELF